MATSVAALMTKDHFDFACNAMGEAEVRKIQEMLVASAQVNGKKNVGVFKHETGLMFVYSLEKKTHVHISVVTKSATLAETLAVHAGLGTNILGTK